MTSNFFDNYSSITIGTGNILENEEFKKAKNPTQEMILCMSARIKEIKDQHLENGSKKNGEFIAIPEEDIKEDETSEGKTKTVIKIFLNEYHNDTIEECLNHTLKLCKTAPNVILAYTPKSKVHNDNKFIWADNDSNAKENFKNLWTKLREQKKAGRIEQLGIADMDLDTIIEIFDDKNFDFTILQINIVTCCMPPPELVSFCKTNDIQLLTHSDPQEILPTCHLCEIDLKTFKVKWIVRYLETLICRGIITRKGFISNFKRV